ncbi:MAG: lysophospholipid acyltransferase family protein [Flavobacteriaceae bacterium]|nr:MAG: 1-acyl-sn-glycerol-3-phosphate acyltransferase [Bacteroidota bacterium]
MKAAKYIFWTFYNIWFYLLVFVFTIIIILPSFIFVVINKGWYKHFYKMGVLWSDLILLGMGLIPIKNKSPNTIKNHPYIFVANHVSMIDVMLLVSTIRQNPLVFIGKKELEKIPIFGFIYKRTMILVDRSSNESKKKVFEETKNKLNSGISLGIFPEGTVPGIEVELAPFKHGAFTMAIEHQVPIVPMTFLDNKKRFPWSYGGLIGGSKGSPGKLRVKIHEPIDTTGMVKEDRVVLSEKVRKIILDDLRNTK